jgi:hypothetical protein
MMDARVITREDGASRLLPGHDGRFCGADAQKRNTAVDNVMTSP